jgi:hypothetical protein
MYIIYIYSRQHGWRDWINLMVNMTHVALFIFCLCVCLSLFVSSLILTSQLAYGLLSKHTKIFLHHVTVYSVQNAKSNPFPLACNVTAYRKIL